jgi:hypothetical protein
VPLSMNSTKRIPFLSQKTVAITFLFEKLRRGEFHSPLDFITRARRIIQSTFTAYWETQTEPVYATPPKPCLYSHSSAQKPQSELTFRTTLVYQSKFVWIHLVLKIYFFFFFIDFKLFLIEHSVRQKVFNGTYRIV